MALARTPARQFSAGFVTVAAASGAAYATLHTTAANVARIREIGIFVNAATASSVELVYTTTASASTSVLGQALDSVTSGTTTSLSLIDTAWSVAPAVGTNVPQNKITIPATIGNGVIWTWNEGEELIVQASTYIAFWNFGAGAGSVLNCYCKWSE